MVTDPFLGLACAGIIGSLFGLILAFGGYRFFLVLLPIWGFFFGFGFGAQTMQALFGEGFLATITSWVVGFVFAAAFAVLSYLFYIVAVALIAASLGYALGVGILTGIGLDMGFLVWLVGVAAGVAVAFVVIRFNVQKYVIMAATSILGAGVIFGTFILMFNPYAEFLANPVKLALKSSWLLWLLFVAVAVIGFTAQLQSTRNVELETYNRLTSEEATSAV